jgi:diguanylate cyclase (GGDEF)-like protein
MEADSLSAALASLEADPADAVLLDLGLPDSFGINTLHLVRQAHPSLAVVVLTSDDRDETVLQALREGAQEYLLKGEISGPLLARTLRYAVERNRLEEELRRNANFDSLTGLFSRRHLIESLEKAVAQARRYEHALTVCLCDLDHLKEINDGYGHQTGDTVLAEFGSVVTRTLRTSDFAGRYGGDEFIFVFPHTTPEESVFAVERIRANLAERTFTQPDGASFSVTCTFGIAGTAEKVPPSRVILQQADEALYEAKSKGRNCLEMRVIPQDP